MIPIKQPASVPTTGTVITQLQEWTRLANALERKTSDSRARSVNFFWCADSPGEDPGNSAPVDRPEIAVAERDAHSGASDAHLKE